MPEGPDYLASLGDDRAVISTPLQEHALCRGCRYPLRDLPTPRCPECGREFDPDEPRSMRLPRSMRPCGFHWPRIDFSKNLNRSVYGSQFAAALAVVWGFALLPGGLTVGALGIVASLGIYLCRHAHRALQLMILPAGAVPALEPPSQRYRSAMRMILLLLILTLFDVPLRAHAALCRPLAQHYFDSVPKTSLPIHGRWVGFTFAIRIDTDVSGAGIAVFGGGGFRYQFDGASQRLEYRDVAVARKLTSFVFGLYDRENAGSFDWRW